MNSEPTKKKKTNLGKIILIIFGVLVGISILRGILFPADFYKEGLDFYNKKQFEKSYKSLLKVDPDHEHYNDAIIKINELKIIIDSIQLTQKIENDISAAEKQIEEALLESESELSNLPENTFEIGDEINFGKYTLTVVTYEEKPYYNSEFRPEPGNKYIAVEFLISNNDNNKLFYNALEFSLYDENSYKYDPVVFGFKTPYLNGGELMSGRKERGWITFEVPNNSTNFEVKYTPGVFLGDTDYFIKLYN